jgi:DNA-binding LytR/AlgR family response regulator
MHPEFFFYRDNWTLRKIYVDDVLFLDTAKNYLTIVLGEGERYNTSRCSLEEALKQLPAEKFARINSSQAVALEKISYIGRTSLLMEGGGKYELTVSPRFIRHLKSKILILGRDRTVKKK